MADIGLEDLPGNNLIRRGGLFAVEGYLRVAEAAADRASDRLGARPSGREDEFDRRARRIARRVLDIQEELSLVLSEVEQLQEDVDLLPGRVL